MFLELLAITMVNVLVLVQFKWERNVVQFWLGVKAFSVGSV
jgi:hypothetical protein